MSSCQFCDEILVLDDGQIAEQGDHAALLEQVLRLYQGRAVYEGSLSDEELLPLVRKYGLLL